MPRYRTEKTTAIELTNCETALIASQFIPCVIAQANRWLLLRFLSNFEHDFPARVASRDLFLRFNRLGKRERLRHDQLDFFLVDQLADLCELVRIRLDAQRCTVNPVLIQLGLV